MKWIKITTDAALFHLFKEKWVKCNGYRERHMWAWMFRKPKGKKRELIFAKLIHREFDNGRSPGHVEVEGSLYALQAYSYMMPVAIKRPVMPK